MNMSISKRELRRWHAWFDKPWPKSKADLLSDEYWSLFDNWPLGIDINEKYGAMAAKRNEYYSYIDNPSRHDPRGCGL